MTASSGAVFLCAPDFENPLDQGGPQGDNVYEVQVAASDGTLNAILVTISPSSSAVS